MLSALSVAQATCFGIGVNTCRTKPRRFRLAPVPASRSSRSHIRRVWWRVCLDCTRLALAHRWAEARQMGSCWSRDNADRNVNHRVRTTSKMKFAFKVGMRQEE
jgi:hypothetical protein